MNVFFFKSEEYARLYNCSAYAIDQIPLAKRQHFLIGALFLCIGIICAVHPMHGRHPKAHGQHLFQGTFMFFIAITDMMSLVICAIITGYFAIIGAVFCTAPTFIYISGAFGLALWVCESTAEVFLAFNRCVEMTSVRLANFLFGGRRIYLWLVLPSLYGLYLFIFTKPILFTGLYVSWFTNPHVGYIDDTDGMTYRNDLQSLHNFIFLVALSVAYFLFALILFTKGREINAGIGPASSIASQKKIFIQVALISCLNSISAVIWISMKFVTPNEFMIYVGQLLWILSHGLPPFIYLFLNKTVRQNVFEMLFHALLHLSPWKRFSAAASSAHGSSAVAPLRF